MIAHEIGHITGGHLARRDQALGGRARHRGDRHAGGAIAAAVGGQPAAPASPSPPAASRRRSARALAHSRAEEAAADQAGLRYLAAAGGDPAAILEVLRAVPRPGGAARRSQPGRLRAHPPALDRAHRAARGAHRRSCRPPAPDPDDVYWHARMVAKFTRLHSRARRRRCAPIPPRDASETAALAPRGRLPPRARASRRALANVDALIAARPDDPYYHELKGQFLLEAGQAGAGRAGLPPRGRAGARRSR